MADQETAAHGEDRAAGTTGAPLLSVVVPAFNEEAMVPQAAERIAAVLDGAGIDHEIVFVDDGSSDGTWPAIEAVAARPAARVEGVRFSRNFGKESALFAGLERARGDCCVCIDCDLQHPPEKIVDMYRLWEGGYEVVEGIKEDRGEESGPHALAAHAFYRLLGRATGVDMDGTSDFKLLDRKVVDALNALPERGVFFRALSFWVGFRRATVTYRVQERAAGRSKWSTRSLFKYAVRNVTSFSSAPLQLVTVLGAVTLVVSVVFGVVALVQKLTGRAVDGFTTVILLLLFVASVIMLALGLIGYYLARIYEEIKGRPRYIVSEVCGVR